MGEEEMKLGPVQVLVVAFEEGSFEGKILAELRRLREHDVIRMIDLIFVAKDEQGDVVEIEHSDLSAAEAAELGALAGALIGLGADGEEGALTGAESGAAAAAANGSLLGDEDAWYLADAIPPGTAAAIALIEHRWAIPLRDAIEGAGGHSLVDSWVHPEDLVAIGAAGGSTGP
jgi:uncharacterized membrane protein